eukprot:1193505-Prorocentrum_minimum.AAC.2
MRSHLPEESSGRKWGTGHRVRGEGSTLWREGSSLWGVYVKSTLAVIGTRGSIVSLRTLIIIENGIRHPQVSAEVGGVFKPYIFAQITELGNPNGTTSAAECYCALNQHDYRGTVSVTFGGYTCRPWSETNYPDDQYPGAGLEGGHNYCRNPDGDSRVW